MILRQHGAVKQRITFTAPINNDDIENVRNIGRDVDRTESSRSHGLRPEVDNEEFNSHGLHDADLRGLSRPG